MLSFSFLLHANALYAEIPFSEIDRVTEASYLPMLELVLRHPEIKVTLNFSGFTLELLNGEYPEIYRGKPEVIALLREGLERRQLELTGTSWSHMILPLALPWVATKDIEMFLSSAERILGYQPQGFFPPELAISPLLPSLLRKNSYTWSYFDRAFIGLTEEKHLNAYNEFEPVPPSFTKKTAKVKFQGLQSQLRHLLRMEREIKEMRDFTPIRWIGAQESSITGIPYEERWGAYTLVCLSRMSPINEKRLFKMIDRVAGIYRGFFMLYSDIELFGYGGNVVKEGIPISRMEELLRRITDNEHIEFVLPSDYVGRLEGELKPVYLKSGSWSTDKDFALWAAEADNQTLNHLASEAAKAYEKHEADLGEEDRISLLKSVLLAFNSDGRGWTPLPEHRLFCYNQALRVMSYLEAFHARP
jgi:predicted glycosyl hydrolase (DUF1957 family)